MHRTPTPQQHHRAVSNDLSPESTPYPTSTTTTSNNVGSGSLRRKSSFSFLRRGKSRERASSTGSVPQRKLSKQERSRARQQEMMHEQIPSRPPKIPIVPRQPELPAFGGEDTRLDSASIMSNRAAGSFQYRLAQKSSQDTIGSNTYRGMAIPPVPPIPPLPSRTPVSTTAPIDTVHKSESMAHRGRNSYASSAMSTINNPRKLRRRKDPTPFNVLVVGAKGCGKTSFLKFLSTTLALPAWKQRQQSREEDYELPLSAAVGTFPTFNPLFVESEIDNERIGVTLWDSEGLEANVMDLQLKELTNFIESKFEDTFNEESKVARAPGFRDSHIHCVFLVLDPTHLDANMARSQKNSDVNGARAKANSFVKSRPEPVYSGLDESLDLNVLRALKSRTTVVPVIAKADTVTSTHMSHLKRAVWDSLKSNNLEILEALSQEAEEEGSDDSSEKNGFQELDERDEVTTAAEDDKYSATSVLESPSDSGSSFSASDFDLAKPGKHSKTGPNRATPSPLPALKTSQPPALPFSILSPDPSEPNATGREFPWGFADPLDATHCDFVRLKQKVFIDWRVDLREASRELCYESWRTSRLKKKARRDGAVIGDAKLPLWARS